MQKISEAQVLAQIRDKAYSGEARLTRTRARLALSEVAGACGVTASTVLKWERGERRPRGEPALKYAALIDALDHLEMASRAVAGNG